MKDHGWSWTLLGAALVFLESLMFRGFREYIILEKVNTVLWKLENHKVLLKDPVRPNEGPWLVLDPDGGSSCVPRVP